MARNLSTRPRPLAVLKILMLQAANLQLFAIRPLKITQKPMVFL